LKTEYWIYVLNSKSFATAAEPRIIIELV